MIVPEVSRFMARVMAAVRPTWPEYPDVAAATAVFDAWEAQQDQLRAAAEQAQSIDDLPGWVFDLAKAYGVQRPQDAKGP